jgi:hypothetical protein
MVAAVANEAEVQARITDRLRKALSFLPAQFQVELRLRLRLGHRSVVVDGTPRAELHGRSDVVVTVDGRPLLVVELKAPDVAVGADDIAQALSYARAHDPIVPLACATNGATTIVARSHDGSRIAGGGGHAGTLVDLASSAATVAAADCENAIRVLLGSREDLWRQLFLSWSSEIREGMTGGPHDMMLPLVRGFSVPRAVGREISSLLSDDTKRVILVAGRPQAGVTTVLAQVAASCSSPTLFASVGRAPDLLQGIANRLARELAFPVTKDDLRGWLNTRRGLLNLVAVIDGLPEDVAELVDLANAGCLRLVVGARIDEADEGTFTGAIHGATRVDVADTLDDVEFGAAIQQLETNYSTSFFQGAEHVPTLRAPRALRALVPPGDASRHGGLRLILPVFTIVTLDAMSRSARRTPKQKYQLFLLARAFLDDVDRHRGDPDWTAATWGRPTVAPELAERALGSSHLNELAEYGLISWVDTGIGPRILIRFEEELLHSIGRHWFNDLTSALEVRGRCDRPKDVRKRLLAVLEKRVHDSAARRTTPQKEQRVKTQTNDRTAAALRIRLANIKDELELFGWRPEDTTRYMRDALKVLALDAAVKLFEEMLAEERSYYGAHAPFADDQLDHTLIAA